MTAADLELAFGSMFFPLKMKEMLKGDYDEKIDLINGTLYEFSSKKMKRCLELPAIKALVSIFLDKESERTLAEDQSMAKAAEDYKEGFRFLRINYCERD